MNACGQKLSLMSCGRMMTLGASGFTYAGTLGRGAVPQGGAMSVSMGVGLQDKACRWWDQVM